MDSISTLGTAAAVATSPRPAPVPVPPTAQDDDKANQTPAFAASETQATPPPKKTVGGTVDFFV